MSIKLADSVKAPSGSGDPNSASPESTSKTERINNIDLGREALSNLSTSIRNLISPVVAYVKDGMKEGANLAAWTVGALLNSPQDASTSFASAKAATSKYFDNLMEGVQAAYKQYRSQQFQNIMTSEVGQIAELIEQSHLSAEQKRDLGLLVKTRIDNLKTEYLHPGNAETPSAELRKFTKAYLADTKQRAALQINQWKNEELLSKLGANLRVKSTLPSEAVTAVPTETDLALAS